MSGGKVDVRDMTMLLWPEKAVTCSLAMPSPPYLPDIVCVPFTVFSSGISRSLISWLLVAWGHTFKVCITYICSNMQPEQTNIRLASVCLCTPMNSTNPVLLTRCKLSHVSNPLRLLRVMRCAGNIRPLTLPSYAHHVPPAGKVLSSFFSMYILSSCTERGKKRIRRCRVLDGQGGY